MIWGYESELYGHASTICNGFKKAMVVKGPSSFLKDKKNPGGFLFTCQPIAGKVIGKLTAIKNVFLCNLVVCLNFLKR